MKILLLDIETSPNTAYVWGLFKENIPLVRLVETGKVLCWSAGWYGENFTFHDSLFYSQPEEMLKHIHVLLDEADAVVHYNGSSFDIPTLNKEFLEYGFTPPSPYKQIDLLSTVRSQFRFTSNKLDHVVQELGLGKKVDHRGFQLWIDCMNNVPEAWAEMEEYNIHDVHLLEKLYDKIKPWIKNHPNHNLYSEGNHVCPNCGGHDLQKRGTYPTAVGLYQRYRCNDCGKWSRNRHKITGTVQIQGTV